MKNTLLKINLNGPTFIEQGGSVVKATFVLTKKIKHLPTKIMFQCDEGYWNKIDKSKIKSIEFKQPNEL